VRLEVDNLGDPPPRPYGFSLTFPGARG
jgi:hypothetical protein